MWLQDIDSSTGLASRKRKYVEHRFLYVRFTRRKNEGRAPRGRKRLEMVTAGLSGKQISGLPSDCLRLFLNTNLYSENFLILQKMRGSIDHILQGAVSRLSYIFLEG